MEIENEVREILAHHFDVLLTDARGFAETFRHLYYYTKYGSTDHPSYKKALQITKFPWESPDTRIGTESSLKNCKDTGSNPVRAK